MEGNRAERSIYSLMKSRFSIVRKKKAKIKTLFIKTLIHEILNL